MLGDALLADTCLVSDVVMLLSLRSGHAPANLDSIQVVCRHSAALSGVRSKLLLDSCAQSWSSALSEEGIAPNGAA